MSDRRELQWTQGAGRSGQALIEVSVLAAVVVAALIGMQVYMKRGIMGRWRDAADSIGEQYAPRHTEAEFTTRQTGQTTTTTTVERDASFTLDGAPTTGDVSVTKAVIDPGHPETATRRGYQTVDQLGDTLWE